MPVRRFRALRELWYPTDPAVIARIRANAKVPMRDRGMKTILAGDVVEDIPAVSIRVLLEKGWIEEVIDG